MINKQQLERYAELKIQEKTIKAELDFLSSEVTKQVSEYIAANDGALPGIEGKGKFSIVKRKTWTYSQSFENVRQTLKDLQAEEEATGVATFEEKESVMFKQDV